MRYAATWSSLVGRGPTTELRAGSYKQLMLADGCDTDTVPGIRAARRHHGCAWPAASWLHPRDASLPPRRRHRQRPTTTLNLHDHHRRQLAERLTAGPVWSTHQQDQDLLFTRPDGTALPPKRASQQFIRQVDDAGLPRIGVHGLRHTRPPYSAASYIAHYRSPRRRPHQGRLTTHRSRRPGGDHAGLRPRPRRRRPPPPPRPPLPPSSANDEHPPTQRTDERQRGVTTPTGVKMVSRTQETPPRGAGAFE
jgi:hypothetical protein